jgi:hypothetical protein
MTDVGDFFYGMAFTLTVIGGYVGTVLAIVYFINFLIS